MSQYGRLWQRVWEIRAELKSITPGAKTNTLFDARCDFAGTSSERARQLLQDWAWLEEQMAMTDD